jgi:hypothetical protein
LIATRIREPCRRRGPNSGAWPRNCEMPGTLQPNERLVGHSKPRLTFKSDNRRSSVVS